MIYTLEIVKRLLPIVYAETICSYMIVQDGGVQIFHQNTTVA